MSMSTSAKLIFLCGKMASGKSTLARDLAVRENAVLLVQDDFLNALFPGEITDVPAFLDRYTRLKNALTPYICLLLSKRTSVVLDFAGATKAQWAWFRELIERLRGFSSLEVLLRLLMLYVGGVTRCGRRLCVPGLRTGLTFPISLGSNACVTARNGC